MIEKDDPALAPGLRIEDAARRLGAVFRKAGLEEGDTDARLLVLAATGLKLADLLRAPDRLLGAASSDLLADYARRRLDREPVSRILGRREFWSLSFEIADDVLDPRPDTETLVEAALAALGERRSQALRFLDLGTGCGALLCALLTECPNATGLGIDLSPAACRVARGNVERCGLAERCVIEERDWREAWDAAFDVVVSNPPYIPTGDIARLEQEVRRHDPMAALDGGLDGLAAYRQIAAALPFLLKRDGTAILEFGPGQGAAVSRLLRQHGLSTVTLRHDLAGRERALVCRLASGSATKMDHL